MIGSVVEENSAIRAKDHKHDLAVGGAKKGSSRSRKMEIRFHFLCTCPGGKEGGISQVRMASSVVKKKKKSEKEKKLCISLLIIQDCFCCVEFNIISSFLSSSLQFCGYGITGLEGHKWDFIQRHTSIQHI